MSNHYSNSLGIFQSYSVSSELSGITSKTNIKNTDLIGQSKNSIENKKPNVNDLSEEKKLVDITLSSPNQSLNNIKDSKKHNYSNSRECCRCMII